MGYDLNWTNTTNHMGDLVVNINTATNGWLVTLIMLAVFIVVFVSFMPNGVKRSSVMASFITLALGILFFAIGMFPVEWLSIPAVLLIGSIIYYIWG